MNVFYLDDDYNKAADQICDVHCNKMIIESCQLMSTAHHILDEDNAIHGIMKKTHANHPSNKWVRESSRHYEWLYKYTLRLCYNYSLKSRKVHKCFIERMPILLNLPKNIEDKGFVRAPAAVLDKFKHIEDLFEAYHEHISNKYNEWPFRKPPKRPLKVEFVHGAPNWWLTRKTH